MRDASTSPPCFSRVVLPALALLFALAWAGSAWRKASQHLVVPADRNFNHPSPVAERRLERLGSAEGFTPTTFFAGREKAALDLPSSADGYELVLVGAMQGGSRAVRIERTADVLVSANGRLLGNFASRFPKSWNHTSIHGARFGIDAGLLDASTNRITFEFAHTFRSVMVVSRHLKLGQFLRLALPASAWLLLAALAWWTAGARPGWLFPAGLCIALFAVYDHTLASMKIAPSADYFFSDPHDFVGPVSKGEYTSDAVRHPLFLVAARPIYLALHALFGASDAATLAALYSLVGAANGWLAWLFFRRWCAHPRAAALLTLLYSFAFSTWVFASHYETYIFSSAAVNLFLLALVARDRLRAAGGAVLHVIAASAAALMHPPLLVLNGISLVRPPRPGARRAVIREIATGVLVLVIYLAGARIIALCSGPVADHGNRSQGAVFETYARSADRTLFQAGNVIAGQFAYAFVGQPFPARWSDGLPGIRRVARHGWLGLPALAALAALWALGLAGLARTRLTASLQLLGIVLLPYLLFFWLFNPGEMFLYSAPLVSALLAWLYRGWEAQLDPRRLDFFLLACSGVIMLHNAACLASYP